MKRLIFSFIVVATAILASCNEEFEELTSDYTPNYRDGVYSGDNLTFTVDGEPRTVNFLLRLALAKLAMTPFTRKL